MKKVIQVFILLFILVTASCTNDNEQENTTSNSGIHFSLKDDEVNTRGTPISSSSETPEMVIYGYYTGDGAASDWAAKGTNSSPDYLDKLIVENKNGNWTLPHPIYWPANTDANVSFFAYSPKATLANGVNIKNTTGVPVIEYTVPQDCSSQPDLMIATPLKDKNRSYGAHVQLSMKHALTCLAFVGSGDNEIISKVTISGVYTSGLVSMDADHLNWTIQGNKSSFSPKLNNVTMGADEKTVVTNDGYLMMIPQSFDAQSTAVIELEITGKNGNINTKSYFLKDVCPNWLPGQKIVFSTKGITSYSIVFDGNGSDVQNLPSVYSKIYGENIILPKAPYRPNYIFQGWGTSPTSSTGFSDETEVTDSQLLNADGASPSKTLYAIWKESPIGLQAFNGLIAIGSDGRLTLDGDQDPGARTVYFKYGSLIALSSGRNTEGWSNDGSKIVFNPTNNNYSGDYSVIPTAGNNTITAAFHQINMISGIGDPCRLVGLSMDQILGTNGVKKVTDNNKWMMPTKGVFNVLQVTNTWVSTPYYGVEFLTPENESVFLPAAGYRAADGSVNGQEDMGLYWTEEPTSASESYQYLVADRQNFIYSSGQFYATTIRCVRQTAIYTVAYNANSGTGAPTNQLKTYKINLQLSNTIPTRAGYDFIGWSLNPSATSASFTSSSSVNDSQLGNANGTSTSVTLYAVWQKSFIVEQGIATPRIFIDPNNGNPKLMLTQDHQNYGSLFQFGSVVGWNYGNTGTSAASADFNPTTTIGWNGSWSYGSGQVQHTVANLRIGKGDPCRLVGFTQSDIRTMLANNQIPDNHTWRLPTNDENSVFGASNSGWTTQNGINGVFFSPGNTTGHFLPANGSRNPNGGYSPPGSGGAYWSSSSSPFVAESNTVAYALAFLTYGTSPQDRRYQYTAYSIRCTRQ